MGQFKDPVAAVLLGSHHRGLVSARTDCAQIDDSRAHPTAGESMSRNKRPLLGSVVALDRCLPGDLCEIGRVGEPGLVNILIALDTSNESPCPAREEEHEWD